MNKFCDKLLLLITIFMVGCILVGLGAVTTVVFLGPINPRWVSIPIVLTFDSLVVGGLLHSFIKSRQAE